MSSSIPINERSMIGKSARTLLLVRLLQLRLHNEMVESLRLFELTPLQYMVLSLASRSGNWSTADLARRFDIAPQSMNEVVAALEGKKLIARRESPDHRRILHIRVKASGARLLQKCDREIDRIERSAFRSFSSKELTAFRGMLSKLLSAFEQDVGSWVMSASVSLRDNSGRRENVRPQ
jgi:DNA-binding MarR family transcriptional regulator